MNRFLLILVVASVFESGLSQVCNIYCDGRNPNDAVNIRVPVITQLFGRNIELYISDQDNMGYAQISGAQGGDEVWLDRSWDGGRNWEGPLGYSTVNNGDTSVRSDMFNVDNPSARGIGALRVCGSPGDLPDIACTDFARSTVNADSPIQAGATAMMQYFNGKKFDNGWWTGANCLTAMLDYFKYTGNDNYRYVIDGSFDNNQEDYFGNFTNDYIDDTLWWGLAWVGAYDVTGDRKYLEMAEFDSNYAYDGFVDDYCGGGVWWRIEKDYKNAITNELFIKLAASLHNRIGPGDTKYLNQAIEVWNWFRNSGMINNDNLINDGLDFQTCQNNGQWVFTYNQGVILGGLVELHKATGDNVYLDEARKIADAVLNNKDLIWDGILHEGGDENGCRDCGNDGNSFKGAFMRNIGELDRYLQGRPYKSWIDAQSNAVWNNARNSLNHFGNNWLGPYDGSSHGTHHSGFEAIIAAQ